LLSPTQHPELQSLPALLWQQWLEVQSEFLPQPLQPLGIWDAAMAAVGAATLVMSGAANAAAPTMADFFISSRRETPLPLPFPSWMTSGGVASSKRSSSWAMAASTSSSLTGRLRDSCAISAMREGAVWPSQ
jgi:hypothetical protein